MGNSSKLIIVILVLGVLAAALALKQGNRSSQPAPVAVQPPSVEAPQAANEADDSSASSLKPMFIDLGSTTCIPCLQMVPVMDSLRARYGDALVVRFINVNENHEAAREFDIQIIPTQVLIDTKGKEVFRHEGFWAEDEIVAKLEELGLVKSATTAEAE